MKRRAGARGGVTPQDSGGDALTGDTRTHPEHVAHACVSLLSRKRPRVLCWRRHGRVGGCQIILNKFICKWYARPVVCHPAATLLMQSHDFTPMCASTQRIKSHICVLA